MLYFSGSPEESQHLSDLQVCFRSSLSHQTAPPPLTGLAKGDRSKSYENKVNS